MVLEKIKHDFSEAFQEDHAHIVFKTRKASAYARYKGKLTPGGLSGFITKLFEELATHGIVYDEEYLKKYPDNFRATRLRIENCIEVNGDE